MKTIDKLAWLHIKEGKILLARSKNNDTYYIPGGKREDGERDEEALTREVMEELSVDLVPESIKFAGVYVARAHGKPEGVLVKMTCYTAEHDGDIKPSSEIEEVIWVHHGENVRSSLVTSQIMDDLELKGILEPKRPINILK